MKGNSARFILVLLALAVPAAPVTACTTFCLEEGGSVVFGKSYDWDLGDGMLVVNKRGVMKTSLAEEHPARWTSRYGSVTFNQYGRELPCGGMNERGLVVELMWLDEARYPAPDERGALPTLQWIQYQLDNCATVDEVIATDSTVRINEDASARVHFLAADAGGEVAAIEHLGGKMVVHRGGELPARALTNDTYESSLAYLKSLSPGAEPASASSLDRFARAARASAGQSPGGKAGTTTGKAGPDAVRAAFGILEDVAQEGRTRWSIVYDLGNRRVHFRTLAHREVRVLELASLDFRCATPVRVLDVNARASGDVLGDLIDYSSELNRSLVRASFAKTGFLRGLSSEVIERVARAPESMICAE